MRIVRGVASTFALLMLAALTHGQERPPLADRVDPALLPSGITQQEVDMSGQLAYLFKDEDGSSVTHIVGGFSLRVGDEPVRELKSREAIIWITERKHESRSYRHLEIYLWRDAEIRESAGTLTLGPALFATLSTFGEVLTHVDDFGTQTGVDNLVFQEGSAIRKAVGAASPAVADPQVAMRVFDAGGKSSGAERRTPKPAIYFHTEGELTMGEVLDRRVVTVIGGAYLSRGVAGSSEFVEIQADNVVVFLSEGGVPLGGTGSTPDTGLGGKPAESQGAKANDESGSRPKPTKKSAANQQLISAGFGDVGVDAVYLEGDVIMTQGPNAIRASRLYYDPSNDRALILDAIVHTMLVDRNIPLYLRAAEIRQLSASHYTAEKAMVTTSEFHTPHYHLGAERVELTNLTAAPGGGKTAGVTGGNFRVRDATFRIGGVPIGYWPSMSGPISTSETAIRSVRTGYSDDFGAELETKWHLFNLLDLETPDGFDSSLNLDYFSDRGPAIGVEAEYERDKYFGVARTYLISDEGRDSLGSDREIPSPHDVRGRALLRHRQYLEDDWQASLEMSFISDRGFLEEFFESEFDREKDQETLFYLKKQRENWAFTSLLQWRPLDFYTQTERFPDFAYFLLGEPIGGFANWYTENRLGFVRYRPADQTIRQLLREGELEGSGMTARGDTRHEFTSPFDLGSVRFVPFASARGTAWDDAPDDGAIARFMGGYGVRGSGYLWRTFPDAKSTMFDIDGVRHIIKPDVTAWVSHSNVDSHELYPFDETVEQIDEIDGMSVGVRQRWQTKRGVGDNRRVVDLFTWDVDAGVFNDATGDDVTNGYTSYSRPENSIARNYVASSAIWRVNDRTALLNEVNYDLNDGDIDVFNLSMAVERSPRFAYIVGYRFIGETDSNLLGMDVNYRLSEKHTVAIREQFDIDKGRTLDFTVALIRRYPRWFSALSFELDEAEDDFGVSFSVWPEGLPQAAIGSKRFTGLAGTTRISNQ